MGEFGDIWFKPLWQMTAAERVRVMQIWRQGSAAMPSQEWIDTEHARLLDERNARVGWNATAPLSHEAVAAMEAG